MAMASIVVLLLLPVFFFSSTTLATTSWGYEADNGPATWGGLCQSGKNQSPVNIATSAVENRNSLGDIQFGNYNASGTVEVENNGHGVEVSGFADWSSQPYIQGGGLGAKYLLAQFHFHWTRESGNGSEHQINGKHYVVECHLVHVKEGLTFEQALEQSNGIAAIGVFYEIGTNASSFSALETVLPEISEYASGESSEQEGHASIDNYSPSLHLPGNTKNFYRYNGSLTTPECQEAVMWTVMKNTLSITAKQLDLLRAVESSDGESLDTNVRPVQPLNGRKILYRN